MNRLKHTMLMVILICVATPTHAADDSKTILVDKTKFREGGHVVLFSPSTGEIANPKEISRPDKKKYEVWIEPRDPEFGHLRSRKNMGFALIGKGSDAFKNPKIPKDLNLNSYITNLMKETQANEQFVFYLKARTSTCLIMITTMDTREEVIRFKWRLLSIEKDVSVEEKKELLKLLPQFKAAWNSGKAPNFMALFHPDSEMKKEYDTDKNKFEREFVQVISEFGEVKSTEIRQYIARKKHFVVRVTYEKGGMVPGTFAVKKDKAGKWHLVEFDFDGGPEPKK